MRYLVYFLALANLAYFAWYQYSPGQKPVEIRPAAAPPGINQLVLLSEKTFTEAPVELQEVEKDKEPVEPVAQLAAVDMVTKTVDSTEQANESSEVSQDQEVEPQAASVGVEPKCYAVGPLSDTGDVASISEKLSRQGFELNVRGDKVREPAGYWVYMPAMPAAKAQSIVADLDAKGMKDYFIGRKNHISLGIFSTEKKARKRLKRVKVLGYNAELGQRYRSRAVYWLDIGEQEMPLLGSQSWETIQVKHPDISAQQLSCAKLDR